MPKYEMAGLVIEINVSHGLTRRLCEPYKTEESRRADIAVTVTKEDIEKERSGEPGFSDGYYEFIHVYRRICERLPEFDGMLLHSVAVAVDGKAYLFSAVSGTGKTTHAEQWKKLLGEKVTVINGDKPIIRRIDGVFYACGTPWAGKEGENAPVNVPIAGICKLTRAAENSIRPMEPGEILPLILNQTMRLSDPDGMDRLLSLIDGLVRSTPCWLLGCNISVEAAEVSYRAMSGEKGELNGL